MATQTITTPATPSRTLSAKLYSTSMVEQATASSVSETLADSGVYSVVFTEAAAIVGNYRLLLTDVATGIGVASWEAYFVGTDGEVINATEFHAGGSDSVKLDNILARITPITTVYTSQPNSDTLNLVRGDAYDGVANAELVFNVSKDVTGETINFTIRDNSDTILIDQTHAGVVGSGAGTVVTVSLSSEATELLTLGDLRFDCEVHFSSTSRWTVANGIACITADQSR